MINDQENTPKLVQNAINGDRDALAFLVNSLQKDIFSLCLRMLGSREGAEDATQEILVRFITHLSQFDFRSSLKTWVYRIGVNYILDVKKSAAEKLNMNFEQLGERIIESLQDDALTETDESVLIEEVKIGCTFGMLQCLDRPHRLAYILGEIFEFQGPEAAEILDVTPGLFRKRLQLARSSILNFTRQYCGLVSNDAPCRCNKMIAASNNSTSAECKNFQFAVKSTSFKKMKSLVQDVEDARRAMHLHQTSHPQESSVDFAKNILLALDARQSGTAS